MQNADVTKILPSVGDVVRHPQTGELLLVQGYSGSRDMGQQGPVARLLHAIPLAQHAGKVARDELRYIQVWSHQTAKIAGDWRDLLAEDQMRGAVAPCSICGYAGGALHDCIGDWSSHDPGAPRPQVEPPPNLSAYRDLLAEIAAWMDDERGPDWDRAYRLRQRIADLARPH